MAHTSLLDKYNAEIGIDKVRVNNQSDDRTPLSKGIGKVGNELNPIFKHIGMNDGTLAVVKTSTLKDGRTGELGSHGDLPVTGYTTKKHYSSIKRD